MKTFFPLTCKNWQGTSIWKHTHTITSAQYKTLNRPFCLRQINLRQQKNYFVIQKVRWSSKPLFFLLLLLKNLNVLQSKWWHWFHIVLKFRERFSKNVAQQKTTKMVKCWQKRDIQPRILKKPEHSDTNTKLLFIGPQSEEKKDIFSTT